MKELGHDDGVVGWSDGAISSVLLAETTLISLPSDALAHILSLLAADGLAQATGVCRAFRLALGAAAAARAARLGRTLPTGRTSEPLHLALRWVERTAAPVAPTLAAGGAHTLALGLGGARRVFSWGGDPDDFNNHASHLGHGKLTSEPVTLPTAVLGLEQLSVCAVAAGDYVSCILSRQGEVWTVGRTGCSLLGRAEPSAADEQEEQRAQLPQHVAPGLRVVAVACGASHSLLVCEAGGLYSWGWGESGALGHGVCDDEPVPRRIEGLTARVHHFCCGGAHSLAVCADEGRLFAWGDAEYGRLGLGMESGTVLRPCQAGADVSRYARCGASRNHSLAVCAAGGLWSFGSGDLGMLGHGDRADRLRPTRVSALRGVCVHEAAAGWHHSAALDSDGRVYTFGFDDGGLAVESPTHDPPPRRSPIHTHDPSARAPDGVLGHEDRFHDDDLQLLPRVVQPLLGHVVVEVACGAHHTVVRLRCGAVLTFGEGRKGALGTGALESACQPQRVLDKLEMIAQLQRERDALMAALRQSTEGLQMLTVDG